MFITMPIKSFELDGNKVKVNESVIEYEDISADTREILESLISKGAYGSALLTLNMFYNVKSINESDYTQEDYERYLGECNNLMEECVVETEARDFRPLINLKGLEIMESADHIARGKGNKLLIEDFRNLKTLKEQDITMNEDPDEGWGDDVEDLTAEFFDFVDRVDYEIKNARRGSYAGIGTSIDDLAQAFSNISDMATELSETFSNAEVNYSSDEDMNESASSDEISEEVTIDTPTQEDLDKDEADIKALDKKQIEDRIGELRLAIEDEALSDDEKESAKKELDELENELLKEESKNANKDCKKKQLKEDSYEEPFFAEIEDALTNAGFDVTRYSDAGMLTSNLGWIVSNSEGEVNLTCAGTYLTESDDEEEKDSDETCEDKKEISDAKSFDEVIDLLIADEEEAIEGYNEAIEKLKELDEKEKEKLIDMLSHIKDDEEEHIRELENKEIEEDE